jgi:serine/threonine protein kinase/predicted ATPase
MTAPVPPPEPNRFAIETTLGSGGMGVVYAAWDRRVERRVALKTFHEISGDAVYRIKNEFRALADIHHENLVRLDELHFEEGRWFFTMELVSGESFRSYVSPGSDVVAPVLAPAASGTLTATAIPKRVLGEADTVPSVRPSEHQRGARAFDEARLRGATAQLVAGLAHLHDLGRVHCDVKPSNVLVTKEGRVVLLDFGLARLWNNDGTSSATHGKVEGTIAYMAPEQAAGERPSPAADLYAVGAMLYESLAGRLPFEGSIVQVLAEKQRSAPPRRFAPNVPEDLASLAMDLLERDPKARPTCDQVIERLGASAPVMSGPRSTGEIFVGRTKELRALERSFDESRGALRSVFVRGQAGVGKSALARTFAAQARMRNGAVVFASRCHEQEALPLKAVDGIVDDLSHHLLASSEVDAALAIPREIAALVQAFPALARVPVVERAARVTPGVPLSPEQRDRAADALVEMLRVVARNRPVILLADDLQWADDASWPFLAKLMADVTLPILFLATARPASDAEHEPLRRLAARGVPQERIEVLELDGLPEEDSIALLNQTVSSALDVARARVLAAESKGHPLFLKELSRLVASDPTGNRPVTLISALDARIAALSARERDVLETVCLAGSAIDLAAVTRALGLPTLDGDFAVQQLKGSQLLRLEARGDARFAEPYHDRIREVVESRLEDAQERRVERHEAIGRALFDLTPERARGTVLFTIVDNFNRAATRRNTPEARAELARLNLEAAKRAADATAHAQALAYLERSVDLLGADRWREEEDLAFEIEATRMETQHVSGDVAAGRRAFRELAERATSPEKIGRIYAVKVQLESNTDSDSQALDDNCEGMAKLGFPSKRGPGVLRKIYELLKTSWKLRGWDPGDIAALPVATDPRLSAAARIGIAGGVARYRMDTSMLFVQSMQWIRIAIDRGLSFNTPNSLLGYAMFLAGARRNFARAGEFARAAMKIVTRVGDERNILAELIMGFWLLPWLRPWKESIASLKRTANEDRRVGEYLWVNTAMIGIAFIEAWLGSNVDTLSVAAKAARDDASAMRWRDHVTALDHLYRWGEMISGRNADDPLRAFPPPEDASARLTALEASWLRMQAEFHFGTREAAHAVSHALQNEDTMAFALVGVLNARFYRALSARARMKDAGFFQRIRLRRDIKEAMRLVGRAARSCPENFRARLLLLEADTARVDGSAAEVDRRFADAIACATETESLQPLAMAHELWAEALLERGDARAAEQVSLACEAWERYGAPRIARRVEERLRA